MRSLRSILKSAGRSVILSDFDPIDDHGKDVTGRQHFERLVTGRAGIGVDLDLAVHQVDDPVERDARAAVDLRQLAVIIQAGIGDLDDQGDIGRARVSSAVIAGAPAGDASIRFGFAIATRAGDPDGLGRPDVPAARDDAAELVATQDIRRRVGGVLGHLGHQETVDQMDPLPPSDDAGIGHRLVLLERQAIER
jgi:hypothetical protein